MSFLALVGLTSADCSNTVSGTDPGIPPAPVQGTGSEQPAPPDDEALPAGDTSGGVPGEHIGTPGDTTGRTTVPPPVTTPTGSGLMHQDPDTTAPLVDVCENVAQACSPVNSAEKLPGRVLPEIQLSVTETITPQQIYETFEAACGRCHKGEPRGSNGGWAVNSASDVVSDSLLGETALGRLLSTDPKQVMPPTRGALGTVQPLGSDEQTLVGVLQDWLAQGRTDAGFTRVHQAEPPFFRYPDELRESFTNLGSCIPAASMVGCAQGQMQKLDAMFSKVRSFADLPKRLEETDLTSFDSAALAQTGVISYAPTYTLFSDGAKKMRYVRVPLGQKIHYDPDKNDLVIPPSTRFYKTFLRAVIDKNGNHSYRKLETRIIVARPDVIADDGTATRQVIFGSYLWSLDEARAELVELPYRDRTPFRDLALRSVTDEQRALKNGFDPDTDEGINAALGADDKLRAFSPTAQLDETILLTRGYALPGRDRCIQCHMGSSSQSYILGFNPYQVDRRRAGEGGVFDDPPYGETEWKPGVDELSQLQRLVDYGVLDGVPPASAPASADEEPQNVFKLEESQLPQKPRNEYELKAQAYMMGNCAFCHNPRGFPSIQNPSLKSVLNFLPFQVADAKGGIFHFDIDKVSPRTSRTATYAVEFPYVIPSLFERQNPDQDSDMATRYFTAGSLGRAYVAAPWRSLLFRNTGTPFTYSSDDAIHPHMPLNVAGYDKRVPAIMGDWMLSIPAKLKPGAQNSDSFNGVGSTDMPQPWQEVLDSTDPAQHALYLDYVKVADMRRAAFHSDKLLSYDQDYAPKCPSSVGPDCVDSVAEKHAYIGGLLFLPDTSDVFAPEMRGATPLEAPEDVDFNIGFDEKSVAHVSRSPQVKLDKSQAGLVGLDSAVLEGLIAGGFSTRVGWRDLTPDRPDWLLRDLTIPPGAWVPRRANWAQAFASEDTFLPPVLNLSDLPDDQRVAKQAAQERRRDVARLVYDPLMHFKIGPKLRAFATTEQPYGLWQQPTNGKTGDGEEEHCKEQLGAGASAKTVSDFASDPPQWFLNDDLDIQGADAARPVYTELPGESMFNLICINCHGKDADANSLLANTILELTGGNTRVADLRDGLFGNQGANRAEVFPGPTFPSEDTDTLAVRYLLWMGLGGTEATIPAVVLNRVGATRPLGVDRVVNPNAQATPNMLANAIGFCQDSIGLGLQFDRWDAATLTATPGVVEFDSSRGDRITESSLVASNGDAELWVKLCGMDNPPPIRAIGFNAKVDSPNKDDARFAVRSAYWRDVDGVSVIPPHARFGDQHGRVTEGLSDDNNLPWCLEVPGNSEDLAALVKTWHSLAGRAKEDPPFCPDELFITTGNGSPGINLPGLGVVTAHLLEVPALNIPDERRDAWATRGAMNIGASVFLYLDGISKGKFTRKPSFDACALPAGH